MKLTLYGQKTTRAMRVIWMLEELGLSFEHVDCVAGTKDALEASPTGKVPALDVDGTVITDSTAILTFLTDHTGKLTAPAGTLDRARQDALTQQINDELDAILWTAARHSFILPEEHRVRDIKPSLRWEFSRNAARLMERAEGPFLMGEAFTVPDMLAAHCGIWARVAKFELPESFAAYTDRCVARDAYRRAVGS
ncbi:glutathione S-transferase family protein [Palleronia abyssalis]|uniref:Glutathione S-transferase n=1 Tax=Palleronia abyssalis TaxID=1501240 RepID=A0A2R8BTB0_9RHOB|nr:glutathione S-transferase family protein [Palleronia abyssalis]SPJ23316.1 Glutathione S-transferase [Palleronia abyssalis]